jgi:hypothetical protein
LPYINTEGDYSNRQQPYTTTASPYPCELQTHTGNDNKDHDTEIHLVERSADGSTQLGSCSNADNSGSDSTEYNDQSDHVVTLQIDVLGIFHGACRGFSVHLWRRTNFGSVQTVTTLGR